jgi:hypothetical protein
MSFTVNVGPEPEALAQGIRSNQLPTCIANAHLIAAAPTMLEALLEAEQAIDSADYFRALALNPHTRGMSDRALVSIRAAIAIVRGGK